MEGNIGRRVFTVSEEIWTQAHVEAQLVAPDLLIKERIDYPLKVVRRCRKEVQSSL